MPTRRAGKVFSVELFGESGSENYYESDIKKHSKSQNTSGVPDLGFELRAFKNLCSQNYVLTKISKSLSISQVQKQVRCLQ